MSGDISAATKGDGPGDPAPHFVLQERILLPGHSSVMLASIPVSWR